MPRRQFLSFSIILVVLLVAACSSTPPATGPVPSRSPDPTPAAPASPSPSFPVGEDGNPESSPVPLSPNLTIYAPAAVPTICPGSYIYDLTETMSGLAYFTINTTLVSGEIKEQSRFEWVGPAAARWRSSRSDGTASGRMDIGTKAWMWNDQQRWDYWPQEPGSAPELLRAIITNGVVGAPWGGSNDGTIVGDTCSYDITGKKESDLVLDGAGRLLTLTSANFTVTVDYTTIPSLIPPSGD